MNSIPNSTDLPAFHSLRAEDVIPSITQVLAENREKLRTLLENLPSPLTWQNWIEPLEALDLRLDNLWSPIRHLNSVMNSEALRNAHNACLPLLSDYASELSQNSALYAAYVQLATSTDFQATATTAQRKLVEDALRDFRLNGVNLEDTAKQRLRELNAELSTLTARYEEHVLDATQAWTLHLSTEERLTGLPPSAMGLLAQNAQERGLAGHVITLDFPSYLAVMTHAEDRSLRQEVYTAYVTRASDCGPMAGEYDNSTTMLEILQRREEKARLTGFTYYAERSLATKMVKSPSAVESFLLDLAQRARAPALADLEELRRYARTHWDWEILQPWDIAYVSEKIRNERFQLREEDLRPYFPAHRVVAGLFGLVEKLFGLQFREDPAVETWHEDVRFYWIEDQHGECRAGFYLDLYARSQKRGGAWMDVCRSRCLTTSMQQLPVAYMTCNSTPPVGTAPALFTHDEVVTLFHEFGHGLHHMLTRIEHPEIAGISGVEWDAVELPSQFMENWCWEREVLDLLAAHHETGERLPEDLYRKLLATRHFQAGLQLLRQVEFALFDMRLHHRAAPSHIQDIQDLLDTVRAEVAVIRPPEFNRFQHGFTHIFSGGYAAGYYSYKWAEVMSADAYARFEEEGLFSPVVGAAFLREILEMGAARPALDSFVAFRGREPVLDALLRHHGLEAA